jgi:hypothetical protein
VTHRPESRADDTLHYSNTTHREDLFPTSPRFHQPPPSPLAVATSSQPVTKRINIQPLAHPSSKSPKSPKKKSTARK